MDNKMNEALTYEERIRNLAKTKAMHTKIKMLRLKKEGKSWDMDDKGLIPPPLDFDFNFVPNHSSGSAFGAKAVGENFRRLLETHPTYIDPMSSLAGGCMTIFAWKNDEHSWWNPDFDFSFLEKDFEKFGVIGAVGGRQHFFQDIKIGYQLGWRGILEKIRYYKNKNELKDPEFYEGLENTVLGIQNLILRHSEAASKKAQLEKDPIQKENLLKMAKINLKLVEEPPDSFHEAVQWLAWFLLVSLMFNGSGTGGAIDEFLKPYYDNDISSGVLTEEEAMFHLACLLVKDNTYYQIGGTDIEGNDITNRISFLILEAINILKIPSSIYIRVHEKQDPELIKKAVSILFKDRLGSPNFVSDESFNKGFVKNGYPIELARTREKCGCHWCSIPGREYSLNDVIKINFVKIFDISLKEMVAEPGLKFGSDRLWNIFEKNLKEAVRTAAQGIDFHMKHMHKVFPELVLDLLCHGPIEKGLDASNGGVEYYNICIDGAGLATVADSFAAIEQRVEKEKLLSWKDLIKCLETDFKDAEDIRLMLRNIPRYGCGGTKADEYAIRISKTFTNMVKDKPTPEGFNMIPGIFSWSLTIYMGEELGATPNGRKAGQRISHGANPDPGFSGSDSITDLAVAVASVQSGYGNATPLQIELDPALGSGEDGIDNYIAYIKAFFDMGGTLLNTNILNKEKILEAHKDPTKYPDLIVRVTGFSAYFSALSDEFRQMIVDRIIEGC